MSIRNDLGTLEASGLVQVAALEPELEYLFRHALVQDAAYSSLLKQDRRALHRLAADTLVALYADRARELAAVIALHLERAGDPAAAAAHLVIAGEHALERFANREALTFFDRADASLTADDPRVELRLRAALGAAKASWTFSGPTAAIERLERALAAGEASADRKLVGDVSFWIAFLRRLRGEQPETSPELRRAIDRAADIGAQLGDPLAQALPNGFMAIGMMFTGQLRPGTRLLESSLEAMESRVDPLSAAIMAGLLTIGNSRLGDFAAAERSLAFAERLAKNGDPIAALDVEIARSAVLVERGDIAEGEALASSCAMRSEVLGAVACGVTANVIAGAGHLAHDDPHGAEAPLVRGEELALVASMAPFQTLAEGMLGSVRVRLGDAAGGTAMWTVALERARGMNDRYGEAITVWQRAHARAGGEPADHAGALEDLDVAVRLFEAMEALPSLARALRDRARILRALGRTDEAATSDRRSTEIALALGLRDFTTASA